MAFESTTLAQKELSNSCQGLLWNTYSCIVIRFLNSLIIQHDEIWFMVSLKEIHLIARLEIFMLENNSLSIPDIIHGLLLIHIILSGFIRI